MTEVVTDPSIVEAATEPAADKPAETKDENPLSPEQMHLRRSKETHIIASSLFRSRILESSGKLRPAAEINANPTSKILYSSEQYGNLSQEQIDQGVGKFPHEENPDVDGEPVYIMVNGERARLVQVTGINGENNYVADYIIENKVGDADASRRESGEVSRQSVLEGNIVAERAKIEAGYSGDELAVVKAYIDSIDPEVTDPSLPTDEELRAVAEGRMLTPKVLEESVNAIYGKDNIPEEVTLLLSDMDLTNKVALVDKADIQKALNILGVHEGWFDTRSGEIVVQIDAINKQRKIVEDAGGDVESFNQRLGELNTELKFVQGAGKMWRDQEAAGNPPLDTFAEMVANGGVDPEFFNQMRSGKLDKVFDGIATEMMKGKSDAEIADIRTAFDKLKSGSLQTIKFGGILMAILAAIPAAAAAGVVYMGYGAMSGAGRR